MCEICVNVKLYEHFYSPKIYLECNNYMKQLVDSGDFEQIADTWLIPLDKIKDENGCWVGDIICHEIRCKKCGQYFSCGVNTYRGGGSFERQGKEIKKENDTK